MHGHFWTIMPHFVDGFISPKTPGLSWKTQLHDSRFGSITLTGFYDELPESDAIVIIIHGMCSTAEVPYVIKAGQDARASGMSSLRINLRGADRCGEDIYHAGLVEDLQAAVESPEVQRHKKIYVLGFSLGGHVTMRYALEPDRKVLAAVAICAPVALHKSCRHIDEVRQRVYRRHLLQGLRECTAAVQAKRNIELSHVDIRGIGSMREWDTRVVARRFGFRNATDYYNQVSVGPHLNKLAIPSLLIFAQKDPMVSEKDVLPSLATINDQTEVRWVSGGHVSFPQNATPVSKAMDWLQRC